MIWKLSVQRFLFILSCNVLECSKWCNVYYQLLFIIKQRFSKYFWNAWDWKFQHCFVKNLEKSMTAILQLIKWTQTNTVYNGNFNDYYKHKPNTRILLYCPLLSHISKSMFVLSIHQSLSTFSALIFFF